MFLVPRKQVFLLKKFKIFTFACKMLIEWIIVLSGIEVGIAFDADFSLDS